MQQHTYHLKRLGDDFLQRYFDVHPAAASYLGLHAYDGRSADLSRGAIASWIAALQDYQRQLNQIDANAFAADRDPTAWLDYHILCWQIAYELWRWSEQREYRRNPLVYAYDLIYQTNLNLPQAVILSKAKNPGYRGR